MWLFTPSYRTRGGEGRSLVPLLSIEASQQVHQQLHNRHNIINLDVVINFSMKPPLVGVDSTGFPAVQGDPPSDVPGQMPNLLLNLGRKTEFA